MDKTKYCAYCTKDTIHTLRKKGEQCHYYNCMECGCSNDELQVDKIQPLPKKRGKR